MDISEEIQNQIDQYAHRSNYHWALGIPRCPQCRTQNRCCGPEHHGQTGDAEVEKRILSNLFLSSQPPRQNGLTATAIAPITKPVITDSKTDWVQAIPARFGFCAQSLLKYRPLHQFRLPTEA